MKFNLTKAADEAIWLLWQRQEYKFYIVIEKNIHESSWHFITRNGIMDNDLLDKRLVLLFRIFRLMVKLRIVKL